MSMPRLPKDDPTGHAVASVPPAEANVSDTAFMNTDKDPFVASAYEDVTEGRVRRVPVAALAPTVVSTDLDLNQTHVLTDTFVALWENLSEAGSVSKSTLLSVMSGITIEPRHPAYRVTTTGAKNIYQAQVGDNIVLVFRSPNPDQPGTPTWLAVLREH